MTTGAARAEPVRVFLDANILFSAALVGQPPAESSPFALLWTLAVAGKVRLVSSRWCVGEAQHNLRRKRPADEASLAALLADVEVVADPRATDPRAEALLPAKDAPVLSAALASGCRVLITGDLRHFGPLMTESLDLTVKVTTLRAFLLGGPGPV